MLKNECFIANIGVDTAENEPLNVFGVWGADSPHPSPHGSSGPGSTALRLQIHDTGSAQRDASTWKVLIFDRHAQDIIAPQLKVGVCEISGMNVKDPPNFERLALGCIEAEFCK